MLALKLYLTALNRVQLPHDEAQGVMRTVVRSLGGVDERFLAVYDDQHGTAVAAEFTPTRGLPALPSAHINSWVQERRPGTLVLQQDYLHLDLKGTYARLHHPLGLQAEAESELFDLETNVDTRAIEDGLIDILNGDAPQLAEGDS